MSTFPFYAYKQFMIDRYGEALFRIPIDLDLGCPHRLPDGSGGCTFCPEDGARAMQTNKRETVEEQIRDAIQFSKTRYRAGKFMAYFQAFTSTLALASEQRKLYADILSNFSFDAVSIGTRPDCLPEETLDFLEALSKEREVWIELGIQSVHDETLTRINRGHDWAASEQAIHALHERNINVAAHVILGLPGETASHFNQTAETLASLPLDGVKIHNLHIIKGTALEQEYAADPFPVYDHYEYGEFLMDFIRRLPADWPIIRTSTDTPKERLVAPHWPIEKGQFIDYINQQMTCREWRQGDLCKSSTQWKIAPAAFREVETEDQSLTFWSDEYKEHFHTPAGARLEAEQKYVIPSQLKEKLERQNVQLLDVCFGLGYNSLCACETAQRIQKGRLHVTALEMDRRVVHQASESMPEHDSDTLDWKSVLHGIYENAAAHNAHFQLNMHWGDARFTSRSLPGGSFDIVYLDAFSTQRNSELWTLDFFRLLKGLMKPEGVLLTYAAALPVRAAMLEAGFFIGETDPVGRKRAGTIAAMREEDVPYPIPEKELETIQTTSRGFPYRDPHLCRTNREILRARQERIVEEKSV